MHDDRWYDNHRIEKKICRRESRIRFIRDPIIEDRPWTTSKNSFYSRFIRFLVKFINLSRDTAGWYRAAWILVSRKSTSVTDELWNRSRSEFSPLLKGEYAPPRTNFLSETYSRSSTVLFSLVSKNWKLKMIVMIFLRIVENHCLIYFESYLTQDIKN